MKKLNPQMTINLALKALNTASRLLLLPVLLLWFATAVYASPKDSTVSNIKKADYYIDDYQDKIDLFDDVRDGKVDLGDSALTAYAGRVYFKMIDSIQRLVEHPKFEEARRKPIRETVYLQMRRINSRTIFNVKRFDAIFRFMQGELNAIHQNKLNNYLQSNIRMSFNTLGIFKNESCADSFLVFAAQYRPDLVFSSFELYSSKPYALHVLEEATKIDPVKVKRYFNPKDEIYKALLTSNDTAVKVILRIKDKYSRKSNAFTLIDDIVHGYTTIEKADATGNNPQKYLRAMLTIRARKNPLAARSLEDELQIYALKFVRVINDLHNEKDEVRFASIEDFSAQEMYTLMVYSEEEIFTSTFNGLFNRMMVKMGDQSGFDFLKSVGDNKFRTFIKMCAGFGKLGEFLGTMSQLHQQMLMVKFATGLEQYNDLSQAVEVADAFGSITDSLVLRILRGTIKYEYVRLNAKHDHRGMALYGLFSNLFVDKNVNSSSWFSSVSKQYALPAFDRIKNEKLFAHDSINRWQIYFYDDEDGEASFAAFRKTFTDSNWAVIDSGKYIIIKSKKGMAVNIYANKPKDEYEGQAEVEKVFADNFYEPNVLVHRGHSYYAPKTIDKIKDETQIFVLGSCGGYHSISTIIEKSSEASIISSKQIGTMFVNNPMLKLMAGYINKGEDVEWQKLWDDLEVSVKSNPKAYERFLDYIPPHKNLGAIFIKTYNRMIEQQN
ncbi:MAG TPA: hypothetical protein VK154_13700 [Chitinophagales bacterium]|nr:hypothetical protein [Chitinophagales bacterium]